MEDQKQALRTRIKEANNVLITVSNNPSADQLAAALGLTLSLNKLKKHATAVYSGDTPRIIEFLEPQKTFEKNTDSLRDFIISLDREKADKLRYKLEDKVVKIFISPYRTSIKESDLQFSQGDFNVDLVVALGVQEQKDLDQAITSHGRILHDATVATVNIQGNGTVGSIHWVDDHASCLSEMIASLAMELGDNALDDQIATAYLTGIVAETDRFSNDKTRPATMSVSSKLMAAGANQQLVASEIEAAQAPKVVEPPAVEANSQEATETQPAAAMEEAAPPAAQPPKQDGILQIDHDELEQAAAEEMSAQNDEVDDYQIHIDEHGHLHDSDEVATPPDAPDALSEASPVVDGASSDVSDDALDELPKPQPSADSDEHPPIIRKPQQSMLQHPPRTDQIQTDDTTATVPDGTESFSPLSDPDAERRNSQILSRDNNDSAKENPSTDSPDGNDNQPSAEPPSSTPVATNDAEPTPPPASNNTEEPVAPADQPVPNDQPQTLSDLEAAVHAHQDQPTSPGVEKPADSSTPAAGDQPATNTTAESQTQELDEARQAIMDAVAQGDTAPLPKVEALNAQPVDLNIHPENQPPQSPQATDQAPTQNPQQQPPPPGPPPMMPPTPSQ